MQQVKAVVAMSKGAPVEVVTINVPEGAHDTVKIERDEKKGIDTVTIRSKKVVER